MGTFRIEITAVGGHGCQREQKHGDKVEGCGQASCPDCQARRFVEEFKKTNNVSSAVVRHWPDTPEEVKDNLLTGVRTGSF